MDVIGTVVVETTVTAPAARVDSAAGVATHTGYQELAAGGPNASEASVIASTDGVPDTTIIGAYSSNYHTPFSTNPSTHLQNHPLSLPVNSRSLDIDTSRCTIRYMLHSCGQYNCDPQPRIF